MICSDNGLASKGRQVDIFANIALVNFRISASLSFHELNLTTQLTCLSLLGASYNGKYILSKYYLSVPVAKCYICQHI